MVSAQRGAGRRENGECGRWLGEDYFTHNAGGYDFRRDAGARCGQAGPGLGRTVASCQRSSVSFQIQSHEKTPFGLRRRCNRTPGQLLARGLGGQGWLLHRALRRGGRGHRRRAPGGGPALPLPGLPGGARGLVLKSQPWGTPGRLSPQRGADVEKFEPDHLIGLYFCEARSPQGVTVGYTPPHRCTRRRRCRRCTCRCTARRSRTRGARPSGFTL